MTLKESYQSAYARKNQAIRAQFQTKKATLTAKKKQLSEQGDEALRQAYGEYMRSAASAAQLNRADGRFSGAADNQRAGLGSKHRAAQESRKAETAADVAKVDEQLDKMEANKDKKLADNQTALQQKLEALEIKEAASKSKASNKGKGGTSSGKLTKSQVISLMKMGIYDASFAKILGISDDEVNDYIKSLGQKKKTTGKDDKTTSSDNRLDGTYKPPLK